MSSLQNNLSDTVDQESSPKSVRLISLDALRGANMLFIMGGAGLFIALQRSPVKCLMLNGTVFGNTI